MRSLSSTEIRHPKGSPDSIKRLAFSDGTWVDYRIDGRTGIETFEAAYVAA